MTRIFSLLMASCLMAGAAQATTELDVGDTAPDFTLAATDGNTYTLSELVKESVVVVAWFPKAYTRGCTIECKSLAENGENIRRFEVAYFMASVDPLEDNKGFAAENDADFPLLSDPDKEVARAYGVLMERGFAARHTFYIGKDQKVLAIDREVRPATSAEDMIAMLEQLGVDKRL